MVDPVEVRPEEGTMGLVLRFPVERRRDAAAPAIDPAETGAIVILPVIRVERHAEPSDTPEHGGGAPRRKRQRA